MCNVGEKESPGGNRNWMTEILNFEIPLIRSFRKKSDTALVNGINIDSLKVANPNQFWKEKDKLQTKTQCKIYRLDIVTNSN